jgi:hypothetical protein
MRLDRVFSEGEAVNALHRLGFVLREVPNRPGLIEVTHPQIGGVRVCTSDQLASFAEGAVIIEAHLKARSGVPIA